MVFKALSLKDLIQFNCSVMSHSLRPPGLQHARPPCPSPTAGVYSNSCPWSWWCHPTVSSPCRPLLLLPSIFPSIRIFFNESFLHIRWPKYWSFSFNISPSNEYSGMISFRMDWLDLLAVQGTLKSLLQHHSSETLILQCSAFFIVQLSHPCMTTGKTIALTRQTFVSKVMSLLFNMLSRLKSLTSRVNINRGEDGVQTVHWNSPAPGWWSNKGESWRKVGKLEEAEAAKERSWWVWQICGSFRSSYSFEFLSEIRSRILDSECGRGQLAVLERGMGAIHMGEGGMNVVGLPGSGEEEPLTLVAKKSEWD